MNETLFYVLGHRAGRRRARRSPSLGVRSEKLSARPRRDGRRSPPAFAALVARDAAFAWRTPRTSRSTARPSSPRPLSRKRHEEGDDGRGRRRTPAATHPRRPRRRRHRRRRAPPRPRRAPRSSPTAQAAGGCSHARDGRLDRRPTGPDLDVAPQGEVRELHPDSRSSTPTPRSRRAYPPDVMPTDLRRRPMLTPGRSSTRWSPTSPKRRPVGKAADAGHAQSPWWGHSGVSPSLKARGADRVRVAAPEHRQRRPRPRGAGAPRRCGRRCGSSSPCRCGSRPGAGRRSRARARAPAAAPGPRGRPRSRARSRSASSASTGRPVMISSIAFA